MRAPSIRVVARLLGYEPADLVWDGLCPECGSDGMRVSGERWSCRKCGSGGDSLDLWAASRSVPRPTAMLEIGLRLRAGPPSGRRTA
ncbi:MAG: hypothetical protein ACK41F_05040 [Fimbriimonadaceae bacterium]